MISKQTINGRTRYKVRWHEGAGERSKTFDKKKDAENFEGEVRRRKQAGDTLVVKTPLLSEYADKWWTEYVEPELSKSTQQVYAVQLDLRILPEFGNKRLREITPGLVQKWITGLTKSGVGDASVVKAATVLQSILKMARVEGLIAENPVREIRKPSQRRKREPLTISPQTVEAIRCQLRIRDRTIVSLLAYAGLRPEAECLPLTWEQIGNKTIRIDATKTGR